jgi:hypothetical protein
MNKNSLVVAGSGPLTVGNWGTDLSLSPNYQTLLNFRNKLKGG